MRATRKGQEFPLKNVRPLLNRQISAAGEQGTDGVVGANRARRGRKGVRDEERRRGEKFGRDKTVIAKLLEIGRAHV